MISDLKAYLLITLGLLPGELAFVTYIMSMDGLLTPLNFMCWLGVFVTLNFFITAGFQSHVAERMKAERQQERIEDAE